jgi:hypothetical protein
MSTVTTSPRRTRLAAEGVVAAYIHDLAATAPERRRREIRSRTPHRRVREAAEHTARRHRIAA